MVGSFSDVIRLITVGIEIAGVLVVVVGITIAAYDYLRRRHDLDAYQKLRSTLGRAILLGLELLVAADIINTVAVEPTLDSVLVLAVIVVIRTFLSLSLEVEISGAWPWKRARDGRGVALHGPDKQ